MVILWEATPQKKSFCLSNCLHILGEGGLVRHFQVLPSRQFMSQLCAQKMVLRPVVWKEESEQDYIFRGGCARRWTMCTHLRTGERGQRRDHVIEAKWKHNFRRLEGLCQSTDKRILLMKERTSVPYYMTDSHTLPVCAEVCSGQKDSQDSLWFTMWFKKTASKEVAGSTYENLSM